MQIFNLNVNTFIIKNDEKMAYFFTKTINLAWNQNMNKNG